MVNQEHGGCRQMNVDISECADKNKKKMYFTIYSFQDLGKTIPNAYLYLDVHLLYLSLYDYST